MSTAYFTHPDCLLHDMGAWHPECPKRLEAIETHLESCGLNAHLQRREAPEVSHSDLMLAHTEGYLLELDEFIRQAMEPDGHTAIDQDTYVNAGTSIAMRRAAGAAVAATDAVIDGQVRNAFCAVRPPGHHATRSQALGFCFYNNVAVAARHALDVRGLERVAIIDFDVHHANGTEDIVAGDDRVLLVSFFQTRVFPFSGEVPLGENMINLPMPAGTTGAEVRERIEAEWLPRLEAFAPQMIFISAGFDAHRDDGIGEMHLLEEDYAWITQRLIEVADRHAGGRIVSCLEGGYALKPLVNSVEAHLRVLADVPAI